MVPASWAAPRAESSRAATVTIRVAPESFSWRANSASVASGWTVVTAAPQREAA